MPAQGEVDCARLALSAVCCRSPDVWSTYWLDSLLSPFRAFEGPHLPLSTSLQPSVSTLHDTVCVILLTSNHPHALPSFSLSLSSTHAHLCTTIHMQPFGSPSIACKAVLLAPSAPHRREAARAEALLGGSVWAAGYGRLRAARQVIGLPKAAKVGVRLLERCCSFAAAHMLHPVLQRIALASPAACCCLREQCRAIKMAHIA